MKVYTNIEDAYIDGIKTIIKKGHVINSVYDVRSVGSLFGKKERPFKEVQGYSFTLTNPRNRLIKNSIRMASLGFSFANFIWVLCGRKDVESISFYNKKGKVFSDDGQYYESAFGDRIFGTYNLWKNAKDLLLSDPNTRRALIPIFFPDDIAKLPLDTSCASYIHLMIRENKLDMILSMRSQSAILVFPYDIFLFTMLQEFFSLSLSVELGKLTYFCDSFHYYIEEEEQGKEIISNGNQKSLAQEMPAMVGLSEQQLTAISNIESSIRKNITCGLLYPDSNVCELPEYWKDIMKILWSKAYNESKGKNDANIQIPSYLDDYLL